MSKHHSFKEIISLNNTMKKKWIFEEDEEEKTETIIAEKLQQKFF